MPQLQLAGYGTPAEMNATPVRFVGAFERQLGRRRHVVVLGIAQHGTPHEILDQKISGMVRAGYGPVLPVYENALLRFLRQPHPGIGVAAFVTGLIPSFLFVIDGVPRASTFLGMALLTYGTFESRTGGRLLSGVLLRMTRALGVAHALGAGYLRKFLAKQEVLIPHGDLLSVALVPQSNQSTFRFADHLKKELEGDPAYRPLSFFEVKYHSDPKLAALLARAFRYSLGLGNGFEYGLQDRALYSVPVASLNEKEELVRTISSGNGDYYHPDSLPQEEGPIKIGGFRVRGEDTQGYWLFTEREGEAHVFRWGVWFDSSPVFTFLPDGLEQAVRNGEFGSGYRTIRIDRGILSAEEEQALLVRGWAVRDEYSLVRYVESGS